MITPSLTNLLHTLRVFLHIKQYLGTLYYTAEYAQHKDSQTIFKQINNWIAISAQISVSYSKFVFCENEMHMIAVFIS